MIKIFKSPNTDIVYIETVTEGFPEDFTFSRNGDRFTIDRVNTKIVEVNNALYSLFIGITENGEEINFDNGDLFESYLNNIFTQRNIIYDENDDVFQSSEASQFVSGDKVKLDQQSGTNSGDETTTSIQTKRPLKTINGESIEGSGDIQVMTGDQAFVNQSVLYKAFSDNNPNINVSTTYQTLNYKPADIGTYDDTTFAPVANGVQLLKDLVNLTIIGGHYVTTTNGTRISLGTSIAIDGNPSNVETGGYIRVASGHNEDDFTVTETFTSLSAGTVITVVGKRNAGTASTAQGIEDKAFLSVFGFIPDSPGVMIGFPSPIITSISTT